MAFPENVRIVARSARESLPFFLPRRCNGQTPEPLLGSKRCSARGHLGRPAGCGRRLEGRSDAAALPVFRDRGSWALLQITDPLSILVARRFRAHERSHRCEYRLQVRSLKRVMLKDRPRQELCRTSVAPNQGAC